MTKEYLTESEMNEARIVRADGGLQEDVFERRSQKEFLIDIDQ